MDVNQALSAKQHSIILIASFTANGDMEKLSTALHEGLDAGLTVNEIKEILVQMYAYAGFPRSLNGINTFMTIMDERHAKGIKDEMGKEASPMTAEMNKDEYGAKVRARLTGRARRSAASRAQGLAAWEQVYSVLTHPRCINCHTATAYPQQKDDRQRHFANVVRGPEGTGVPGLHCASCHQDTNADSTGVPGGHNWHLAPLSIEMARP